MNSMRLRATRSRQHFVHTPLERPTEQIRLLRIEPGTRHDNIAVSVEVVDLCSAPDFFAISYTWGSVDDQQGISVNGKFFQVRKNCHYALWQVRQSQGECLIWIDSICIDQQSTDEKSAQVAMMGQIYRSADAVLACIGAGDENASLLHRVDVQMDLDQVERFSRDKLKSSDDFQYLSDSLRDWLLLQGDNFFTDVVDASVALLSRTFWTRVWTIQELFAGHLKSMRIYCGDLVFHWNFILELQQILMDGTGYLSSPKYSLFPHLGRFKDCETTAGCVISLFMGAAPLTLDLIGSEGIWRDGFQCADPRDQVYGLLGLLDHASSCLPPIMPDYSRNAFDIALDVIDRLSGLCTVGYLLHKLHLRDDVNTGLNGVVARAGDLSRRKPRNEEVNISYFITEDDGGSLEAPIASGASDRRNDIAELMRSDHSLICTNGQVSAVVLGVVKAGDIIIQAWHADLVIRPRHDDLFDFVGVVSFAHGYGANSTVTRSCNEWPMAKRWCSCGPEQCCTLFANLEISLSSEEAMVYAASGLRDPELRARLVERPIKAKNLGPFRRSVTNPGTWVWDTDGPPSSLNKIGEQSPTSLEIRP